MRCYILSQLLEIFLELHLLLLDKCSLIDLIGSLHRQFSLEDVEHIIGSGINNAILVAHEFLHHLAVDEHFIHSFLEVLKVVGHDLKIGVVAVVEHSGHLVETTHDGLVVLHGFHVTADEFHLEAHSLDAHGCDRKMPYTLHACWPHSEGTISRPPHCSS